jgi:chemotaxis protein MotA
VDLTSIIGLVMGIGAVLVGQVLEGGKVEALIQPTAFLIVLGGTIGAVMLNFPGRDLMNALKSLPTVFLPSKEKPGEVIEMLIGFALKARKEGILALQAEIKAIEDPFLRKGLEMMTDGTDPHLLRELMETEVHFFEEEIGRAAKVYESAGGYTPTVGILGAVLGLIHVMENLSDPSKLGSGIAVAFVATVYGVAAANLIFLPLGSKIKFKRKGEVEIREMMIEGILSIQAGESPNFIREKLNVYNHDKHAAKGGEEAGAGE